MNKKTRKPDVLFTPVALPHEMQIQPIRSAVHSWLKTIPFDRLVELYWEAQKERADAEDKNAARLADPSDMYGKSPEYVRAYYAQGKTDAEGAGQ